MAGRNRGFRILERSLLAVGICCLTIAAAALLYRSVSSRLALREFDQAQAAAPTRGSRPLKPLKAGDGKEIDFSLWSEKRVQAYRDSLLNHKGSPLAVLRVEKVNIRVPVFEGTDELALNRGVGWIPRTARPGEDGNVGIAGHRDGFFRGLKDVATGDVIELSMAESTEMYTVDQIEIVQPDNVNVLRPRAVRSLTLVTCYPFYFIGAAPQRFIVHAAFKERR